MKKLLQLSTKEFFYGVSPGEHYDAGGVFHPNTIGISPAYPRDPATIGLLCPGGLPVNRGSTVVVDSVLAGITNSTGGVTTLYSIGSSGHLYSHNLASADATPTDLRSATPITGATNGLAVYQPAGGTRYLYYFQQTQIGRWNLSGAHPTGWTDNWKVSGDGVQSTYVRPVHQFLEEIYYGNGDRIGMISDAGGGVEAHNGNVLDFPANLKVHSIADDGYYLVIALTEQSVSGQPTSFPISKVVFWDTISSTWTKEYNFSESTGLISMRSVGGVIYAIDTQNLWVFSYSSSPQKINLGNNSRAGSFASDSSGHANHHQLQICGDGVMWLNRANGLSYYGKLINTAPRAIHNFIGAMTSPTSILPLADTRFYIGGSSKYYSISPFGGDDTAAIARTIYLSLGTTCQIKKIRLVFGEKLESGDVVKVDIQRDTNEAETTTGTWGIASFALHGAVPHVDLYNTTETDQLKLIVSFTGGTVRIKRIEVWGDPTAN